MGHSYLNRIPQVDLNIALGGSGFFVSVPNHQLVQAKWTIASDGSIVINDTHGELMINPLQEDLELMPRFAMTLFQAAYLHVNYDDETFTIWQAANPTNANSKFAVVGDRTATNCTGPSGAAEGNSASSSASPGSSKSSSLSGGAIGGIVVAVFVLGFFFVRRKQKRREVSQAQMGKQDNAGPTTYDGYKPELDTHRYSGVGYEQSGAGSLESRAADQRMVRESGHYCQ